MAESGMKIEFRGPDGRLLPVPADEKARRAREVALTRWAAARTPMRRLAVAFDFVRSVAALAGRGEEVDPHDALDRATRVLWAVGEQLTRQVVEAEEGRDG